MQSWIMWILLYGLSNDHGNESADKKASNRRISHQHISPAGSGDAYSDWPPVLARAYDYYPQRALYPTQQIGRKVRL